MSAISGYINQIQNAVYGEQVRTAIINALQACYSDVENPDLQSDAFYAAILEAYDQGVLDIIEVTNVSQMTNENIIYRYMGTQTGYTANTLYYYNGTMWAPIGSGVREASTAALMNDTGAIYLYTGSEAGYYKNTLYYYNKTAWTPLSTPTDKTLTKTGEPADAAATGDVVKEVFSSLVNGDLNDITWFPGYVNGQGAISDQSAAKEVYSNRLKCVGGMGIGLTLQAETSNAQWLVVAFYNESGFISRTFLINSMNITEVSGVVTAPNGATEFVVSYRSYDGDTSVTLQIKNSSQVSLETLAEILGDIKYGKNPNQHISAFFDSVGIESEPQTIEIPSTSFLSKGIDGSIITADNNTRRSVTPAAQNLLNGMTVTITPTTSSGVTRLGVQGYKQPGGTKQFDPGWIESNRWPYTFKIGTTSGTTGVIGFGLTFSGPSGNEDISNETVSVEITITGAIDTNFDIEVNAHDEVSKGIAHRGFSTIAPENTLPAYKLAKTNGFNYAECDLQLTSDDVPVLIHDATINRTSNGTGNVSSYTFEQLQTYDFGTWKSSSYAGTKIPSFEQFVVLCKRIGLNPYIELKTESAWDQTKIDALVDTLERYSMKENATFISFSKKLLGLVKTKDSSVRLGYVVSSISTTAITDAQALKTTDNEVFIDTNAYTSQTLAAAISAGIPVEMWYGDTTDAIIIALDDYITGVTNNSRLPGKTIYENSI